MKNGTRISLLGLIGLSLLLGGCGRSPGDEILDRFIAMNDSLGAMKVRMDDRRAKLPPVPFADLGCPEYQVLADSMAAALDKVEQAMAPVFSDLAGVPQDDREAGDKSFMNVHHGEALFTAISVIYDIASGIAPNDSTRSRITENRASAFPHTTPEAWRMAYFTNAPRGAVVTVLSKTERDIEQLRGMCDNALLKACLAKN
jgi:hypothetical protein